MMKRGLGAKQAKTLVDQERLRVILTEMQRKKPNFQILKIKKIKSKLMLSRG